MAVLLQGGLEESFTIQNVSTISAFVTILLLLVLTAHPPLPLLLPPSLPHFFDTCSGDVILIEAEVRVVEDVEEGEAVARHRHHRGAIQGVPKI